MSTDTDEMEWWLSERSKAMAAVALLGNERVSGSSRDAPGLSLVLELDGPDHPWVGVLAIGYQGDPSALLDAQGRLRRPAGVHGGSFPVLVCLIDTDGGEGRIGWIRRPAPSGRHEVVVPELEPMNPKAIDKLLREAQSWVGTGTC